MSSNKTVRAKFTVQSITTSKHWSPDKGHLVSVRMTPVVGGSPENDAFFEATPGGQIDLGTVNESAAAIFEPGKSYYIDITAAE